jgi:hypothetical protein
MVYGWEHNLLKTILTIEIVYRFVPGHRGIPGNEVTDHWAMVQAGSESLKHVWSTTLLSHIDRKTVTRKWMNENLNGQWHTNYVAA